MQMPFRTTGVLTATPNETFYETFNKALSRLVDEGIVRIDDVNAVASEDVPDCNAASLCDSVVVPESNDKQHEEE